MKKDPTKTSLADGRKISKDSAVAHAIGALDEANAFIGLAKAFVQNNDVKNALEDIQRMIFAVGSEISGAAKIGEDLYGRLMTYVEEFESKIEKPKKFVILEKDAATAFLSVARAVVRRAERWAVKLHQEGLVSLLLVEWLNKLSYLLYLMILREGGEFESV